MYFILGISEIGFQTLRAYSIHYGCSPFRQHSRHFWYKSAHVAFHLKENLFQTQSTLFDSAQEDSRSVFYRRTHRSRYLSTESEYVLELINEKMFMKKLIV